MMLGARTAAWADKKGTPCIFFNANATIDVGLPAASYTYKFVVKKNVSSRRFLFGNGGNSNNYVECTPRHYGVAQSAKIIIDNGIKSEIAITDPSGWYLNGVLINNSPFNPSSYPSAHLAIGGLKNGDNSFIGWIYEFTIIDGNNSVVMHSIPISENGSAGFVDLINGSKFLNQNLVLEYDEES